MNLVALIVAAIAFVSSLLALRIQLQLRYQARLREIRRCASCGAKLPVDDIGSVEFSQVPVDVIGLPDRRSALRVRFRVCHPCVESAIGEHLS